MSPDFETWLMRGLVAVLLSITGYLVLIIKKGQDARITRIEKERIEDKNEFRVAIENMTQSLKENTTALNEMKVALAENYADFVDAKVYREDIREIWAAFRDQPDHR
jgi:hypothetical protein